MITLQLPDAQRELPALADKALRGEQVFIVVGQKTLQLAPAAGESLATHRGPRPGRGTWKGRVTIPDAFYEPWTGEELGDPED
jgi:hypothetical protein